MKKHLIYSLFLLVIPIAINAQNITDNQIRQQIINESISSYRGNCPCPYNSASNGSRCGKRSAYSRPGGASPKCYANDVSDQEVSAWKKRFHPQAEQQYKNPEPPRQPRILG